MPLDDSFLLLGFLDTIRGLFLPQLLLWWTPISLLGIGVLAGFCVLLALAGVGFAVSRVPALSWLDENPAARRLAIPLVGAVVYVLLVLGAILFAPGWFGDSDGFDPARTVITLVALLPLGPALAMAGLAFASPRTIGEIVLAVREGVLRHISVVLLIVAAFGLLAPVLLEKPGELVTSLVRLPFTGTFSHTLQLSAPKVGQNPPEKAVDVRLRADEARWMILDSNEPLEISLRPLEKAEAPPSGESTAEASFRLSVKAGERAYWVRGSPTSPPLPEGQIERLYVRNVGEGAAKLELQILSLPQIPEASVIPVTALCVVLLYTAYLVQRSWMPRLNAVALATSMSEIAQPLFLILIALGVFLLLLFLVLPFNTFGEDIKMLKTTGLQLVLVLCIIQAVWAAGTSISEEIEGKTALTVLSKPLTRLQFIVGKFLGIVWTVGLMFLILGAVFLFVVAYKPIYDGNEGGEDVVWQNCHEEVMRIIPGLALAFMETVVLAAISVAISTRLSMLANFSICFGIYVLGHLTPLIVQSSVADFEPVAFVGQLVATVFPVLDHFSIEAAVSGGADVPLEYLGWTMLYCLMYVTLAMLLALVLFEDRDVA
jgi:ABC-type transport system involved in multi-copper enzyme maturation permease subunit